MLDKLIVELLEVERSASETAASDAGEDGEGEGVTESAEEDE